MEPLTVVQSRGPAPTRIIGAATYRFSTRNPRRSGSRSADMVGPYGRSAVVMPPTVARRRLFAKGHRSLAQRVSGDQRLDLLGDQRRSRALPGSDRGVDPLEGRGVD